jgi:hypothetical protein
MGYTHYWRRPKILTEDRWSSFCNDIERLCFFYKEILKYGITDDYISINGIDGCETLYIDRVSEDTERDEEQVFDFCKTNRAPYDIVVMVALMLLHHHYPNVKITSDGSIDNEWSVAGRVCKSLFGFGDDFKLGGSDD